MRLSVQLYTVRDQMARDPAATLQAVRSMGYRYVETAGTAGRPAPEFAKMIADAGLRVSGMHVSLEACEHGLAGVLNEAEALGSPYVIVPYAPESAYRTGWFHLGMRLQVIGEKVATAKRTFGYHNHAFEFQDAGGRTGFDVLMESACPDYVKAEIDLWWALCGGQDPASLVRRHRQRTPLVHLKDGSSIRESVHQPAGRGIQNWKAILAACREAKVEYGVVELDTSPGSPLAAIQASHDYFRERGISD